MGKSVHFKAFIVACCGLICFGHAQGQQRLPVKWNFTAIPTGDKEARLVFTANLDEGWHIYSQFLEEGGPLPTTFTFTPGSNYTLKGKVKEESTPVKSYDDVFMMDIVWYKNTVVFSQEVSLRAPAATIRGRVEFMACRDDLCLPPDEIEFALEVKTNSAEKTGRE
jgi:DsbC/DsbD-like thiol-disulfide interchange protein